MATKDKLKHIGIGLLLAVVIIATIGASRAQLFNHNGPILTEAILVCVKDQINLLRLNPTNVYSEITNQQILNAVHAKYVQLDAQKHDWMNKNLGE